MPRREATSSGERGEMGACLTIARSRRVAQENDAGDLTESSWQPPLRDLPPARPGMPVPREARAVDREAGGDECVERLALADRAAVPLLDVQTAHAAQGQGRRDDGLQRADRAGEIDRLPAGQRRERAPLAFDEQD